MAFLKRFFSGKKSIQTMRIEGDLFGLIAALDDPDYQQRDANGVWHSSPELVEAIVGFGGTAIEPLVASANVFNRRSQAAVLGRDTVAAGRLMNSRRFRIEVLGQIPDQRTIRPLLDAFADGIEAGYIPPAVREMMDQQLLETTRQYLHPESATDSQFLTQQRQMAHMQGEILALTMPAKWLADVAYDALITKGTQVVEPVARALPYAGSQLRLGLIAILENIGGTEAIKALQSLLNDPNNAIRQRAQEAIHHIQN